ncbi:hypothetical protein [uncultured Endozoicomonas sp.]|uniref:hypothetical protein n=1 Tax=uncultured Endozoicomonas sp. TaxID=432652 RepID=UPI002612B2C5|nr:hypothetical protein [uncultured Endozoicomonas sp.]
MPCKEANAEVTTISIPEKAENRDTVTSAQRDNDPPSLSKSDSVADLLDELNADEEDHTGSLSSTDIRKIIGKRMLWNSLMGVTSADVINDLGYPKAAGYCILLKTTIGFLDGMNRIGQSCPNQQTGFLKASRLLHQCLHTISDCIPDNFRGYLSKLYYFCPPTAMGFAIAADIIRHLHDAGIITASMAQVVAGPAIIVIPAAIMAIALLVRPDCLKDETLSETLGHIKTIIKRVFIHSGIGTILGDILGYTGHPVAAVGFILLMAISGLDECGENLEKKAGSIKAGQHFYNACLTMHQHYRSLQSKLPTAYLQQFHKSYKEAAVAGTIGTIAADTLTYFGKTGNPMIAASSAVVVSGCTFTGVLWSLKDRFMQLFKPMTTPVSPFVYSNLNKIDII